MNYHGCKIEVNVVTDLGGSKYGVIIEDNRDMYKYVSKIIDAAVDRLPRPCKVKVNDFCLAMFEDELWHRAIITSTKPLTVYLLDFAKEEVYEKESLRVIPKDLEEDEDLEDVKEELKCLTKIPPLAFTIQTEQYVTLEEGSLAKIVLQEEVSHNEWSVTVIREKNRRLPNSSRRLEIVADPIHVEQVLKKKKTKPESCVVLNGRTSSTTPAKKSVDFRKQTEKVIVLSDEDSEIEFIKEYKVKPRNVMQVDRSSLIYTAVCHQPEFDNVPPPSPPVTRRVNQNSQVPKNHVKNVSNITKGLALLSMNDEKSEIDSNPVYKSFTSSTRDYLVHSLLLADKCAFIVHDSFSDNEYSGMILCKRLEHLISTLDQLESFTAQSQCRPKQGNLVVTYLNALGQWYRGYVIKEPTNIDPFYLLLLFDIGITYRTVEVYPLPEEFHNVPVLAVRCTVTSFPSNYDEIHRLEVLPMTKTLSEVDIYLQDKCIYGGEVTSRSENNIDCDIRPKVGGTTQSIAVTFAPWVPTKEEIGVDCIEIAYKERVKITAISVSNECYVVPVNEELIDDRNEFLESVVLHCRAAPPIDHEPKIREIVGVPHMRSFWRGQITEKRKSLYVVHLLDIGTDVKIVKEDMKELPDNIKFMKCYAARILLDKIPRTDFNKGAEEFLKYIVTQEKEFIVEIDKSSCLADLKFAEELDSRKWAIKKGSSFNDKLNDVLKPLWKLTENYDFGALYFLSNFKFEEWEVNSVLSLLFVEKLDEKNGTFINPKGDVYAKLVEVNLTQRLTEYAEEKSDPYVPVSNELCVAKYDDGNWYRAVCVSAQPGKDLQVHFIDIGYRRSVSHLNIRRIAPDFLKHPAASLFCEISNCTENDDLTQLEGKVLRQCKIVSKIEIGGYALKVFNLHTYFM